MVEQTAERSWPKIAAITVPAIVLAGSASGWLSNSGFSNDWFVGLLKPFFMPPGWLFGVAWTILYALLGLAVAMILALPPSDRRRHALILFFVQLAINFAWSPVFFAAHDIGLATMLIFVMVVIAAAAAGQFFRLRPLAGALMLPYLAWLCFAAALMGAIEQLNPGAATSLLGL